MTSDRDYKKVVRRRMQRTGESYAAARRHVPRDRQQTEGSNRPTEDTLVKEAQAGHKLSLGEVERLELAVTAGRASTEDRARLLGNYMTRAIGQRAVRRRQLELILWFITNRPADRFSGSPYCQIHRTLDSELYSRAATAWSEAIRAQPKDAQVHFNAAHFLQLSDKPEAEPLFIRATTLEPDVYEYWRGLGFFHLLQLQGAEYLYLRQRTEDPARRATDEEREVWRRLGELAGSAFERALSLEVEPETLKSAGRAAIAAQRGDLAGSLAQQLSDFPADQMLFPAHDAHLLLGRAALLEGDVALATSELAAATLLPPPEPPPFQGPGLRLAFELMWLGQTEAVAAFLDSCAAAWPRLADGFKRAAWDVRGGFVPHLPGPPLAQLLVE